MKKLLVALTCFSSLAFAIDCTPTVQQKVIDKLAAKNRTSVSIDYSADSADKAQACKTALMAKNSALSINLNQVSGSNILKFSK